MGLAHILDRAVIHSFNSAGVYLLAVSCFWLLERKVTNQVSQWKRKSREGLLDVFEPGPAGGQRAREKKIRSLHAGVRHGDGLVRPVVDS